MIAQRSNRAPSTYKPGAWSNSDGEFGLAISDDSNDWDQHNRVNPYVMTIEMTPEDMMELAKDLLVVALQKKEVERRKAAEVILAANPEENFVINDRGYVVMGKGE